LIIDDSFTVEQIVQAVAKHIGLKEDTASEFGLRRDNDKKSWLVPTHSLYEEDITPDVILCFARQFFGLSIDQSDPFQLELIYLQSKDSILTEEYPCAKKEAYIQFAALQFQITFGDHDPNKHKPDF
jgi:talin